MVLLDSTTLLLLLRSDADAPIDPGTKRPTTRCAERVDFLIKSLADSGDIVLIPTPVLSEVLVCVKGKEQEVIKYLQSNSRIRIVDFDLRASIEVATMTQSGGKPKKAIDAGTKAQIKYDRQIVAIAKVNGAKVIYSDDGRLSSFATAQGIKVVPTWELPLPPKDPQIPIDLP